MHFRDVPIKTQRGKKSQGLEQEVGGFWFEADILGGKESLGKKKNSPWQQTAGNQIGWPNRSKQCMKKSPDARNVKAAQPFWFESVRWGEIWCTLESVECWGGEEKKPPKQLPILASHINTKFDRHVAQNRIHEKVFLSTQVRNSLKLVPLRIKRPKWTPKWRHYFDLRSKQSQGPVDSILLLFFFLL